MIIDAFMDALLDTAKTLPFLLAAYLAIEALEHYSKQYMNRTLVHVGKAGPLLGAVFGCVPQCGFSVAAGNLYAGGLITTGTLLAVFLSTSDEALLILMSHPGSGKLIGGLLFGKILIGVTAGYLIDLVFRRRNAKKEIHDMCRSCRCSENSGIWRPALLHTLRISGYLLVFTFLVNLLLEIVGVDTLSSILGKDTLFQPFLAALIGLIPNCAASVMLTELYLAGSLSFAGAMAGLCAGAGVGMAVLFKTNRPMRENFQILFLLYGTAVLAGIVLEIL